MRSAHSALEAMSPRLKRSEKPARRSSGYESRPMAATVAGAEPAAAPNTITAATVECPMPPRNPPHRARKRSASCCAILPRAMRSAAKMKKGMARRVTTSTPPRSRCAIATAGMSGCSASLASTDGRPITSSISKPSASMASASRNRARTTTLELQHRVDVHLVPVGDAEELERIAQAEERKPHGHRAVKPAHRDAQGGARLAASQDEQRDREADLRDVQAEHEPREVDGEADAPAQPRREALQQGSHADVPATLERDAEAEEDHPDQPEEAELVDPGHPRRVGGREVAHQHVHGVEQRHRQHQDAQKQRFRLPQ